MKIMNKKIKLLVGLALSVSSLLGLFAFTTPASAASEITCNSAVISAWVDPQGSPTTAWMQWGTSPSLSGVTYSSTPQTYNSYQTINATATGLSENTTYYYRGRFQNSSRGSWDGSIASFTTKTCGTATPTPTNPVLPQGYLDGTDCSAIWGWSVDFNNTSTPVHIEVDDIYGRSVITGLSNLFRGDVNSALGLTGNHAFHIATPASLKDGVPHKIYVYGVDLDSSGNLTGNRFLLNGSPKTITCNVPPPPTCQDRNATNYGGPLPCVYPTPAPTCQDPNATNYGGSLPCRYPPQQPPQTCQDPNATNYGGSLPCVYPQVVSGNLTISPSNCTISPNQSTCTTGATWTTQNATSPSVVDRNTGVVLSNSANRSTPLTVWVTFPSTTFDLKNGSSILDTEVATASCASGTTWNGSVCATNSQNSPTVTLTANPSSIQSGQSSTLVWNSQNTASCFAAWTGSTATSGSAVVFPSSTTNYSITCSNNAGQQASASATVIVNNNNGGGNPSVNIYADDTSIDEGDDTIVRWDSNNADYCTASGGTNGWSGSRNTSGSFDTGSLDNDETYRITCYNQNGSATDSVTINVDEDNNDDNDDEPDVTTKSATNVTISSATLNGRVDGNGRSVRAWFEYGTSTSLGYRTSENSYGSGSTNYSRGISGLYPNTTYYFRAMAENSNGTARGSILTFRTGENYIYNPPVNNQPTVVIFADSTNVAYNGATTIRWSTYNASSCVASGGSVGWAGIKSIGPASFYTGSLTSSRTYTITCTNNYGSATDYVTVNVHGRVVNTPVTPTSYVIINSSVDRNQPIVPTIDNTRPHPGDEINYTVTYQNIGNASITNLTLRLDLPYEVDYMFSTPNNPIRNGNTLIFNLGTLRANAQGTVNVRVRVRENVAPGALLNFPAILTYTDPFGNTQSVSANVSAQVWSGDGELKSENIFLGANVFGADFLPDNLFGWLLLLILILILILLARYLYSGVQPFKKRTTTTTVQH